MSFVKYYFHRILVLTSVLLTVIPVLMSSPARRSDRKDADIKKSDYIYIETSRAYNEGRFDDYIMLMRRAKALSPDDPYIAGDLAEIEMQISRDSLLLENAYRSLRRRFDADPTQPAYYTPYIKAAMALERLDDQIDAWARLDSLMPDRNDPAMREAITLMQRYALKVDSVDFNRAMAIFNRLEQAMGPSVDIASQQIRAYMFNKDTVAAEKVIQRLANSAPKDVRTNILVGSIYDIINKPDSAIAYYDRAERADTTDGTVDLARADFYRTHNDSTAYNAAVYRALRSQNLDVEPKFNLLVDYIRKQYTDSANWPQIDDMFQVLEEVNPGEARIHMLYGEFKSLQGLHSEAAEQFSYSIDLDPTARDTWADLIQTLTETRDNDRLLQVCRRGLDYFPGDLQFISLGSMALAEKDDFPGALRLLDSIGNFNEFQPKVESELHRIRGDYFERMGERDSSYTEYEKAIAADAGNYMAMNNAAYFMSLDSLNLDKAKLYASLATESNPSSPTYLDTYAWVMFRRGEYEEAKTLIDRALALYSDSVSADTALVEVVNEIPADLSAEADSTGTVEEFVAEETEITEEPSAEVFDHAGDIYFMCGQIDRAVEFWKQAEALEPENKIFRQKIKHRKIVKEE